MNKEWSIWQKKIFLDIHKGTGNSIIEALAGSGKCLGKGTPVLLFDGTIKPAEDIIEGDLLMGPDSKPRTVLSTSIGYGNMVKIIPVKGDSWICNDEHILTLIQSNYIKGDGGFKNFKKGTIKDISVKQFISENKDYVRLDKCWKLIRTGVEFPSYELPFDPYLIGLWIGDGTKSKPDITSADQEIIDYCKNIAPKYKLECMVRKESSAASNIRFRTADRFNSHRTNKPHTLKRYLLDECVLDKEKYIPQNYLINSRDNRLQLLAGIIDTDGSKNGNGHISITSSIKRLAEQYAFLARSLGFAAYIHQRTATIKELDFIGTYWVVNISGDLDTIPVLLPRKKCSPRKQIKNYLCTGFDIQHIGQDTYYGFTLDGDGRFLLGDFTITHNTSTIIESFKYVPRGKKVIALAFNKIIQQELQDRSPSRVACFTFHSLGLQGIRQRFKTVEIDDNKVFNIAKELVDDPKDYDLILNICDTVAFCKYSLVDSPSAIEDIILRYGIDTCEMLVDEFMKLVIKTLAKDKEQINKIDFNDMCWYPFIWDIPLGKYDYVYVDEFQDANRSQVMMAKKVCNPNGGRIIVAGDYFQELYRWRSSDVSIIRDLQKQEGTNTFSLPITYRCPKKIVELVKPFVPAFSCPDTAKDGEIHNISLNEMYKLAKPGCFVLSRVNAPLIKICLAFIREGKRCNIRGRDIGKQLSGLIKKSKKKQIPAFLKWLEKWKNEEVEKLISKGIKPDNVIDKYECLVNFCEEEGSLEEVKEKIDELFDDTDEKNIIIASSTHKSKGLERDEVFLLKWTYRGWFDNIIDNEEENLEMNVNYVAATRSKDKLYLVNKF